MKRSHWLVALLIATAVFAPAQKVSTRPSQPQPGRFDPAIRSEVELYIHDHKQYSQIESQVDGGMVTLTGKVPLFRDRKTLINAVMRMPHVETVRDQIELTEAPVSDKLLMGRLAERLQETMPEGASYQAHEGRVRLTGKVEDHATWSKIISIVDTTPGVQDVEDRLTIAQQERH